MSIVFISRSTNAVDGGGRVTTRNKNLVNSIGCDSGLLSFEVSVGGYFRRFFNILFGRPYGFSSSSARSLRELLKNHDVDCVFIDHSLLAGYAFYIRRWKPRARIFILYHNVEFIYYLAKFRVESFVNIMMLFFAWRNERVGKCYADHHVVLTERDGLGLRQIYGLDKFKVIPISLPALPQKTTDSPPVSSGYHLYVGSNFFANLDGLYWYIEKILPYMQTKLVVVGRGMEFLSSKYSGVHNLDVFGYVEDLEGLYCFADFVVNPVFVGSGMKTKTVEAFQHGKTVLGCKEAFVGLDIDKVNEAVFVCEDVESFVFAERSVLNALSKYKFNGATLSYFSSYLSDEVVAAEFSRYVVEAFSDVST